jgi:hypothetical protein
MSSGATSARDRDSAADDGVPQFLYTVEVVHLKGHRDLVLPAVPTLSAAIGQASFSLLGQAFEICAVIPEWSDPDCDRDAKAKKAKLLQDVKGLFQNQAYILAIPTQIIDPFFAMLESNIFRAIPPTPPKYLFGDCEPYILDIAWAHLSVVYELLGLFFAAKPRDAHFTLGFEHKLLQLFGVPDATERQVLATFFIKYLEEHQDREKALLTAMAFMLKRYRQRDIDPYVVVPVLTVYAARFKEPGFDAEFRTVLFDEAIIPLMSSQHMLSFTSKLTEVALAVKNQSFLVRFTKTAIERWPEGCPAKQVEYLTWINSLAENIGEKEFPQIIKPLFGLHAKTELSHFAKVAETSFKVWSNVKLLPRILDHTKAVFMILHPSTIRTMNEHWRSLTQSQALTALKAMQELDPVVFDHLKLAPSKAKAKKAAPQPVDEALGIKARNWGTIARLAGRADRTLVLANLLAVVTNAFGNPL